jgi:hypothetical protein
MVVALVYGQLATLAERLPTDRTFIRFISCVSVFVLFQVLVQVEGLLTILALELLFGVVFLVVALQAELTLEDLLTV